MKALLVFACAAFRIEPISLREGRSQIRQWLHDSVRTDNVYNTATLMRSLALYDTDFGSREIGLVSLAHDESTRAVCLFERASDVVCLHALDVAVDDTSAGTLMVGHLIRTQYNITPGEGLGDRWKIAFKYFDS